MSATSAPVTLINPFEIPTDRVEDCIAYWERARDFMQEQPGYLSTRLHRALTPDARFPLINVAEWASPADFEAAITDPRFVALTKPERGTFPHHPALYTVIGR